MPIIICVPFNINIYFIFISTVALARLWLESITIADHTEELSTKGSILSVDEYDFLHLTDGDNYAIRTNETDKQSIIRNGMTK